MEVVNVCYPCFELVYFWIVVLVGAVGSGFGSSAVGAARTDVATVSSGNNDVVFILNEK